MLPLNSVAEFSPLVPGWGMLLLSPYSFVAAVTGFRPGFRRNLDREQPYRFRDSGSRRLSSLHINSLASSRNDVTNPAARVTPGTLESRSKYSHASARARVQTTSGFEPRDWDICSVPKGASPNGNPFGHFDLATKFTTFENSLGDNTNSRLPAALSTSSGYNANHMVSN
jgi:hypothetical protein